MASTVAQPVAAAPSVPAPRRGPRIVAIVVVAVVLAVVASGLVFRSAVRAERQEAFRALFQAQGMKAFRALEQQAVLPVEQRSSIAVSEAAALDVPGTTSRSAMTFGTQQMNLGEPTQMMVFDGRAYFDGPWWLGDQSMSVTVATFLTYTDDGSGVSSDAGGCTLEASGVDPDWVQGACTPEQRAAAWAD